MTPEIADLNEFFVVGIRVILDSEDRAAEVMGKFLARNPGTAGKSLYGVFGTIPGDVSAESEYVAGFAAESLEGIPEGMVGWLIPSGKYALFGVISFAGIVPVCREAFSAWLPKSGFRLAPSPIYACSADKRPESPEASWKIHIPLEKSGELERLREWIK
ncbi:MAG: GyrI-like domain-containing protein [Planctomycetota bacterium]|jgi:predicted transcriptional regulator YdeE|nr:GyrI-like domain-containing protein [Planctomycetota bacterium]